MIREMFDWLVGLVFLMPFLGIWLVMSWITAVGLHKTAPMHCPKGLDHSECLERHPFHVTMQNPGWCALLGLAWPFVGALLIGRGYAKSVEITSGVPVPVLGRVNTDRMLEAADADLEKMRVQGDQQWDEIVKNPPPVDVEAEIVGPLHPAYRKRFPEEKL